MTTETKARIDDLIAQLKVNNTLFPDQIFIYNPFVDNPDGFAGITDQIADYIYIQESPLDANPIPDQFQPDKIWMKQEFRLVGRSSSYPDSDFLAYCLQAMRRIPTLAITGSSANAERIYFEETGEELKTNLNLIRITFTVGDLFDTCARNPVVLCLNGNC